MCLWSAEATSFYSLRTSRILGGLAGGLIEALGPSIVVETFQEQHLATAMVVYVGMLAAGSSIGPIVAGAVAQGLGSWRWFFRILAIAIALNLISSIAMLPETTEDRDLSNTRASASPGSMKPGDPSSKPECLEVGSVPDRPFDATHRRVSFQGQIESLKTQWLKRSFSLRYALLDWNLALRSFFQPFKLVVLPQVLVSTLVFGLTIGWTVLVSIIVSMRYAQPPLIWGALPVGLMSIGPLVGTLIGLPFGGLLADFLSNLAARRSGGIHDPATRLPATALGAVLSPAGCLLIGFGLREPSHWAPVAVGWGMLAFGLTSSANVLLTYSVDTTPSLSSHIGALINLTKNCLAFGVSYTSVSWTAAMGSVAQFGTMAGLLLFSYFLVIPVWLYSGALIRKASKLIG